LVEAEAIIGVQCRPVDFCDVAENSKDSGQGTVEVQMRLRILVLAAVIAASVAVPTPVLASGNGQRGVAPANARQLLVRAAQRHGLRPGFVLAVSYWESGWNQRAVSRTGAIGLMQVEPATAAWAGPALLHRRVNLYDAADNAEMGAALLRHYFNVLHDPSLVLAAYYQGLTAVRRHGIYRSSRSYIRGILNLARRL
jgi:soluble lytic murein transglycosylase-like protein